MTKYIILLLCLWSSVSFLTATTFKYDPSNSGINLFEKKVENTTDILNSSFVTNTFSSGTKLDFLAKHGTKEGIKKELHINSDGTPEYIEVNTSRDTLEVYQSTSSMGINGYASSNTWTDNRESEDPASFIYDIGSALLSFSLNGVYSISSSNSTFKSNIVTNGIYLQPDNGGVSLAIKTNHLNKWYVNRTKGTLDSFKYEFKNSSYWYELDPTNLVLDKTPVVLDYNKHFITDVGIHYELVGFALKKDYLEPFNIGVSDFELTNLQAIPESKTYALTLGIISIIFFLFKRRIKLISHD